MMHPVDNRSRVPRYITFAVLHCILLTIAALAAGEETDPIKRHACRFTFVEALREGEAGYRENYRSVRLRFEPGDWQGATINESSAWGGGSEGKDLWGWIGGSEVVHSEVAKDKAGYYFVYSLKPGGASTWISANFRYTLSDGSHGVGQAIFPYSDAAAADSESGQPAESAKALAVSLKPRATLQWWSFDILLTAVCWRQPRIPFISGILPPATERTSCPRTNCSARGRLRSLPTASWRPRLRSISRITSAAQSLPGT